MEGFHSAVAGLRLYGCWLSLLAEALPVAHAVAGAAKLLRPVVTTPIIITTLQLAGQYSYQPASEQLENWLLDISQIGAVLPANAKAKASASLILAGWLVAGC
jgi:hypothetical protein